MFVACLRSLGAVRVEETAREYRIGPAGRIAAHLPEILYLYLTEPLTLIENWNATGVVPDDVIGAVELVRRFETRRVELTVRAGRDVRPLAERPVAFALFHAVNERGEDCYLFEVNKDWKRLNFIGGKQEVVDRGDYAATAVREIREELGLAGDSITLERVNDEPLRGYGLSGNAGSLASYPCVFFGARVDGRLRTGMQNRWLTERQIRRFRGVDDTPLMVNPVYLDFLLSGSPTVLARTPLSTSERVRAWVDEEIPAAIPPRR